MIQKYRIFFSGFILVTKKACYYLCDLTLHSFHWVVFCSMSSGKELQLLFAGQVMFIFLYLCLSHYSLSLLSMNDGLFHDCLFHDTIIAQQ